MHATTIGIKESNMKPAILAQPLLILEIAKVDKEESRQ
jgi:hypothetical protein